MQLSIEEVKKLDSNSYQIIDIRSEEEVAHGAIKGALNIQAEEIESAAVVRRVWMWQSISQKKVLMRQA